MQAQRSIPHVEYFDGILFNLCDGNTVSTSARRHSHLLHSYCSNKYYHIIVGALFFLHSDI